MGSLNTSTATRKTIAGVARRRNAPLCRTAVHEHGHAADPRCGHVMGPSAPRLVAWGSGAAALRFLAHAFGDDADLVDARALGRVDDFHDLAIAQRRRAGDEHCLVLALFEDGPQPLLEIRQRHVLLVDADP